MKHFLIAFLGLTLAGSLAQAQQGWNWDSQAYHSPGYGGFNTGDPQCRYDCNKQIQTTFVDPSICFERGWDFGGYFSTMFTEDPLVDDGIGGGISFSYFFDANIGFDFNYALHGQSPSQHVFHTNLVYRLPINGCFCGAFAPYAFGGWGILAGDEFDNLFDVGVGLEIRFQSFGCVALFGDASYNFVEKDRDFTQIRAGFKLPF